jgi:hypothetical protein
MNDRKQAVLALPRWYSPWGHLAATVGTCVVAIAIAASQLAHVRWFEALTVPVVFVLANAFEWWVHKSVLHKRRRYPLRELFERHTPEHHQRYEEHSMEIEDVREFKLVLIPAIGIRGGASAFAEHGVPDYAHCGGLCGRLRSIASCLSLAAAHVGLAAVARKSTAHTPRQAPSNVAHADA